LGAGEADRRAGAGRCTRGAEGFAERTGQELLATGATVRKGNVETRDDLTAQETQLARPARDGLSNPEIGAQLFLSAPKVEWHLRKGVHQARDQLAPATSSGAGRCRPSLARA
jgi:DNA-binding CsgD family transcriptional regulator